MANLGTAYIKIAPNLTGIQSSISRGMKGPAQAAGKSFSDGFGNQVVKGSGLMSAALQKVGDTGVKALKVGVVGAIAAVAAAIPGAVKRFDTLQNFPRVMKNFGVKTDDAKRAMDRLVKGVHGLPTGLDAIASLTQAFTPMSKNVGEAAKLALALNDALLAGGTPMAVQTAAMEQFRQALAKGKPQLQDWRSLESAMPAQLQQISKQLGLGSGKLKKYGQNGQGIYQAMQDGKISLTDFNKALLKLDKSGNGVLPSFQKQAHNASQGVGTAFTVMKQGIQSGLVDILKAIGQENISNAIASIGQAFKKVLDGVASFFSFIIRNKNVFIPIAKGITAVVVALTALSLIRRAIDMYRMAVTTIKDIGGAMQKVANLASPSSIKAAAEWVRSAVVASVAWVKNMVIITAQFIATAAKAVFHAVATSVAWVASSVAVLASWVGSFLILQTGFIATGVRAVINAIKIAAAWIASSVATAASWVASFITIKLGFIATGVQAMLTGIKIAAAWVVAMGPIAILVAAIAGIAAVIGILIGVTGDDENAEKSLNDERERSTRIANTARDAQNRLKDALYNQKGAALDVESAQKTLNDATERYGPKSLEAREAAHDLEGAEMRLKTANDKAKGATDENTKAQGAQKGQLDKVAKRIDTLPTHKTFTYTIQVDGENVDMVAKNYGGKYGTISTATFATGGFTGRGDKNTFAGMVHKGEYVIPKQFVNQVTGLPESSGQGHNPSSSNNGSQTIIVKIGEDTLLKKVVNGINNMSYMNNETVLEV